ncbi:MAG: sulfite exporter TauE/SafE family protein [Chloroflexi bacterium]|nr:sulfite exporter TauE/SafE family protein [Chloroflexota bacterium]
MELTLGLTGVAILALALFLGCTVYSATGFGIAMTAMPISLLAISDPQTAVIVVNTGGVSAGILIAIQARKDIPYREVVPIVAAGVLGVPFGVAILKFADPTLIRIGIVVLILLLAALSLKEYKGEIPYATVLGVLAGFVVGATLTAFAVGGPLIVLFLLARNLGRRSVRGAMALYLLVIAGIGVVAYATTGLYSVERLTLVGIVLIPAFVGFGAGALLIQRMNEQIFRYVVLGIIGLSSMAVLVPEVLKVLRAG